MLYTTFNLAHKAGACSESYKKIAKALGGLRCNKSDTCLNSFCPHRSPHKEIAGRNYPNCKEPGTFCFVYKISVNCETVELPKVIDMSAVRPLRAGYSYPQGDCRGSEV